MNALTFKRFGFGVAILFSGVAADASGPVQYTVTDLGTLPGYTYSSYATGINDSGQVVGNVVASPTNGGGQQGFLWQSGSGLVGFGPNSYASAINDSGTVVGWSYPFGSPQAAEWPGGIYTGGARSSFALAINNLGQVAGYTSNIEDDAFFNTPGLGNFAGPGRATGINDSGQVVGYAVLTHNGIQQAFVYNGSLPVHGFGTLGGNESTATAINNLRQVVGWSRISSGVYHAFLHNGGGSLVLSDDLGTLGGDLSQALAINNLGQVVGWAETGNSHDAFLYDGGSMLDLNNLIAPGSGWTLTDATGINATGQICGYGQYGGQQEAFLLTPAPVPEPSTLALLCVGALGLLGWAWRRRRTLIA